MVREARLLIRFTKFRTYGSNYPALIEEPGKQTGDMYRLYGDKTCDKQHVSDLLVDALVGDGDDVVLSRLPMVLMLPKIDFTDGDIRDSLSIHDGVSVNPVNVVRIERVKERLKERLGTDFPHALLTAQTIIQTCT